MFISKTLTKAVIISIITSLTNSLVTTTPTFASNETFAEEANVNQSISLESQAQVLSTHPDIELVKVERAEYTVSILPPPPPKYPPIPANPSLAQQIARELVLARGWDDTQFDCLVALWNKESGWRVGAANPSSGAYGIPQALPGEKMASAGADWRTNPRTQIIWGLGYIQARYGNPCGAWDHSQRKNWY